ncbi:AAA family ATPase [Wenzhouxiangella marina]|uniref:Putative ATPase n=1 Tax=Wenzhouxiangella marina TaxID=1579979 RepID=A0A0K0XV75_9GAMM|nr:MoxR family ATPase [Wenzhouxiangella marina]AKS41570.1 Putative ATPase [Wenzhouxiangella marina]MBB6086671.1 MoxR-like ATPase [Wenzhouxiangella marina]
MNDSSTTADPTHAEAAERLGELSAALNRVVLGQSAVIEQVLAAFLAGGHVLIEGVPGLAKTLLAQCLATTLGGEFSRIQFTPDLMPADITGHAMYDMKSEKFRLRRGPIFCNILLADEINRAPAKTQAALLEVMQEQRVTIEGKALSVPEPFMVLATQNPIEHEGTYLLPEAQLDRFVMKVLIDYPDAEAERRIAMNLAGIRDDLRSLAQTLEAMLDPAAALALRAQARKIRIDEEIADYAVAIARATRQWPGIEIGAGPRASIALLRVAQASALMAGRDFVVPDDVKRFATACLRHRITLSAEFQMEGQSPDEVLERLIEDQQAPRQ